jgi:hypothetical protein
MQTGEAAGVAVALAHKNGIAPAELDADTLVRQLCQRHFLVSFFNDVDVSSAQPWVPAAEYFGAQGFFHDYNVRADQPLKRATAEVWLQGLARLQQGKHDAQALLLKVARTEQAQSPGLTCNEFVQRLPKAAGIGPAKRSAAITRGEAAVWMWKSLR